MVQPLWKVIWRFLKKLKIELSYDPVIPLLGTYPRKMKRYMHLFTVALFTIFNMDGPRRYYVK